MKKEKRLSLCYDGIEEINHWVDQRHFDVIFKVMEGLVYLNQKKLENILFLLEKEHPAYFESK